MQTGTKISAIAHVTLVGWAFLGGVFRSEPLPFEVQEASIITEEQFAALSAPREAPEISEGPVDLEQPEAPDAVIAVPEPDQPEPEQSRPKPVPAPEPKPEPAPEVLETPEPEVPDAPPILAQPEQDAVPLPDPPGTRPKPRPVERVAPEPVAPPPPEAQPDEVENPPVAADEGAVIPQEEQQATALEEATDRIVPDAEDSVEVAPTRSPRPPVRPHRPEPETQYVAEAPQPDSNRGAAVNDALAEVLAEAGATPAAAPAPSGPPLTSGDKDALRVAVSRCWNVGSLSTDALNTTVVVGVSMNQDGTPDTGTIRLIDSSGGSGAAANQAFQAARRAIIRCGVKGFDLPREKYDHWRDIEMTFNPERMRIK